MITTVCWAWVRQLGGTVRQSMNAVICLGAIPIIWAQMSGGMNDLATACLTLGALSVLAHKKIPPRMMGFGAACLLIGLGIKPTVLFVGFPVAILWIIRWRQNRVGIHFGPYGSVFLTLSLCLCSYWYLKNLVVWSNPLYPTDFWIGPWKLASGHPIISVIDAGRLSLHGFVTNLHLLFTERFWDMTGVNDALSFKASGFGTLTMVLGWAALSILIWKKPRTRTALVTLIVMFLITCAAVRSDSWMGRFFVFAAVGLVGCIPLASSFFSTQWQRGIWLSLVVLFTTIGWFDGVRALAPKRAWQYWSRQELGPIPNRYFWSSHGDQFPMIIKALDQLPDHAIVVIVKPDIKTLPITPASFFHGSELKRRLLYHAGPLTSQSIDQWKLDGASHMVIYDSPTRLKLHKLTESLELRHVEWGLYELP